MQNVIVKKWSLLDYVSGIVLGIMLFLTLTLAPIINAAAVQAGYTLSSSTNESP